MTILHIAMFKWNDETTPDEVIAFQEALDELRGKMPILLSYHHGPDLGLRDGNFDYGVVAEVAETGDVSSYLDHPLHRKFAEAFVVPMVAERCAVQIDR